MLFSLAIIKELGKYIQCIILRIFVFKNRYDYNFTIIIIKNYIKKNYYDYSEDTIQELGPASKSGISISS